MNRRFLAALAVLTALWFAWPAIGLYFSDDDVMNLRRAWTSPLSSLLSQTLTFAPEGYRPAGLLWYKLCFAMFGLHPLPFRVFSFVLFCFNLGLLGRLTFYLTESPEIASLTVLLSAFHSRMEAIYFFSSSIYDLLCYCFYVSALICYIHYRRSSRIGSGMVGLILALQVLALGSKEMAVTLPLILLLYEVIYHSGRPSWLPGITVIVPSALIAGLFCWRQLSPAAQIASYRPDFSAASLLLSWQSYLGQMVYTASPVSVGFVMLAWAAIAGTALALRSRAALFGAVFFLLTPLPVCFIVPRGLNVFYLPMAGLAIFVAVLLLRPGLTYRSRTLVIALVWSVQFAINTYDRPNRYFPGSGKTELIRAFLGDVVRLHPSVRPETKLYFLEDPFSAVEWTPSSVLQLYFREPELSVTRRKVQGPSTERGPDIVMTYRGGHMLDVPTP